MPAHDLSLLVNAAQEAGKIACMYSGPTAQVWDKPDGAGPVTEADLAVNEALEQRLRSARPDYGWLSEESLDNPERQNCDYVFIVDPIDGTRSFIEGSQTWAHSLAIAHNGSVVAAVVYLPLRNKLYYASRGQGAFLNGQAITCSPQTRLEGAQVLAAKPMTEPQHWRDAVPEFARGYRPSLAYRMALVADGSYDAMLTLRPTWEWDIAAGDLILREAGATSSDRFGNPLQFNNPDPRLAGIVAGTPVVQANILEALKPAT